ncbi:MAG: signal recognition particle protein [Acidimicrobiaceae bacterium TMED77]|nr:signal recognition particle protein [Acidimicrobiales bacterium]OUV00029.1 MAG: signal recognition particle protein [Acidimicrobiaceae bacterium TMED77]|tara:strand:+ start:762 stop:2189 length:1428 start_codon:yes stop_codon:yes gene_type:complete
MFENLTDRIGDIFGRLRSKGRLSEAQIDDVIEEVRIALLEADVNLQVAKDFQKSVRERCLETEIHKALNPAQQVIKAVNEELVSILGGETLTISYADKPPTVVLLAGLQGVGKTTNAVKLAKWFKSQGRNPLLIGADLQRPAAVEQLRTLASSIQVPVFSQESDPVSVVKQGIQEAKNTGRDVVICDTAGRLTIDEEMMQQIRQISDQIEPHYTLLVIDAMTGQEAVNVAESFDNKLSIDAMILTKLDGDARGGAALSAKSVVGKPIAFASIGEKIEDFELFHPDRLASRILGMGDVLTLIEKAEDAFDEKEAELATQKLISGQFTLEDFLDQMRQLKKMGPLENIVGMMPDLPPGADPSDVDESRLVRMEAIITSMTLEERQSPVMIDGSRRSRIAKGSGTSVQEVSLLLKQFKEIKRMMKGAVKPRKNNKRKGPNKRKKVKPSSRVKQKKTLNQALSDTSKQFDLGEFGTFQN